MCRHKFTTRLTNSELQTRAVYYAFGRLDECEQIEGAKGTFDVAYDFSRRFVYLYDARTSIHDAWEEYAELLQSLVYVDLGANPAELALVNYV